MGDSAREESISYKQDRLGNERKELDKQRSQAGMTEAGNGGILQIASGDTGANQVVYEIPSDLGQVFLEQVKFHDESGTAGAFSIFEVELNDDGTIASSTRRSVPITFGAGATISEEYKGKEFDADGIAVNSDSAGFVGLGLVADHREYDEIASEQ